MSEGAEDRYRCGALYRFFVDAAVEICAQRRVVPIGQRDGGDPANTQLVASMIRYFFSRSRSISAI